MMATQSGPSSRGPDPDWSTHDRLAWEAAVNDHAENFLEEKSRLATWAPRTIVNARTTVNQLIRWARDEGLMQDGLGLADIVTPDTLQRWVRHQRQAVNLGTIEYRLFLIHAALQMLAPNSTWDWIRPAIRGLKLRSRRQPSPTRPIVHAANLYSLGLQVMQEGWEAEPGLNPGLFRSGLAIALLAAAPMRIGNLAALRIGYHLRQVGEGWTIHLAAEETKSRRADCWPVTGTLRACLERSLVVVRPLLLQRAKASADTGRLWIGDSGRPIGDQILRRIIAALTRERLGVQINPHTFRHCAATTFALELPHDAMQSSALLGHASPEVTERHYIIQQRQLVQEDYLTVLRIRRRTPSPSESAAIGSADPD